MNLYLLLLLLFPSFLSPRRGEQQLPKAAAYAYLRRRPVKNQGEDGTLSYLMKKVARCTLLPGDRDDGDGGDGRGGEASCR